MTERPMDSFDKAVLSADLVRVDDWERAVLWMAKTNPNDEMTQTICDAITFRASQYAALRQGENEPMVRQGVCSACGGSATELWNGTDWWHNKATECHRSRCGAEFYAESDRDVHERFCGTADA